MQIMTDRGRVVPGQWVMVITNDGRLEKDNGMTVNTPLYVRLKPGDLSPQIQRMQLYLCLFLMQYSLYRYVLCNVIVLLIKKSRGWKFDSAGEGMAWF